MTNGWECVNGTAVVNAKIAIALFAVCRSQMLTHAIEFIELSGPNFASKMSANSMLQQGVSGHKNPYEMCDIYRIPPTPKGSFGRLVGSSLGKTVNTNTLKKKKRAG